MVSNTEKRAVLSYFQDIGLLSFAQFYDLTIEEAVIMANNPNEPFYAMVEEIKEELNRQEKFLVKIRKMKENKISTRLHILDFSE